METTANGWVKGRLESGQIGYVPSNYVKKVAQRGQERVIVIEDYGATGIKTANGDRDMTVHKGDILAVIEMLPNGWVKAELGQMIGLVPVRIVAKKK